MHLMAKRAIIGTATNAPICLDAASMSLMGLRTRCEACLRCAMLSIALYEVSCRNQAEGSSHECLDTAVVQHAHSN